MHKSDVTHEAPDKGSLVEVQNLSRSFELGGRRSKRVIRAVDDVSLVIERGSTLGLVGESGSGKSTFARLVLRLDRPSAGRVLFDGIDLSNASTRGLRGLRRQMQIVFQDPYASLNRRKTVEEIVSLPLIVHDRSLTRSARSNRVAELLALVGLRPEHTSAYPRQLSGGQCQRVSIARALAMHPKLVVLDEAVSAVDVSIQAQILNLLRDLQQRLALTYLFVTHDLAVVRYMASTVAVMYLGRIVEIGPRDVVFDAPRHPYTHALLASIPPSPGAEQPPPVVLREALATDTLPGGCRFHPRCPLGDRGCLPDGRSAAASGRAGSLGCVPLPPVGRESPQGDCTHMSTVHLWAELTREEISVLAPDALFVLPVGATEQHGPHLATGTDALLVRTIARLAAEEATRPAAVLIGPTLPFGASAHHLPFGGTLSLEVSTFALVLRDLVTSAAGAGCRRAFILNGHGGNAATCANAVAEASRVHGIVAATALFSDLVETRDLEGPVRGHAGVFETSLVLALDAALARSPLARPSPGGEARKRPVGLVVAEPSRWRELDGYTDTPEEASVERGNVALHACVRAVAAAFERIADIGV